MAPRRFALQCSGCGLWLALEAATRREAEGQVDDVPCPACERRLLVVGPIEGHRVMVSHETVPCDSRCVDAVGTSCSCRCGGRNHGTHRVVTVVRDAGAAPRLTLPEAVRGELGKRAEAHRRWVRARDEARALCRRLGQSWLPHDVWEAREEIYRAIAGARALRKPEGRIRRLARAMEAHAPVLRRYLGEP